MLFAYLENSRVRDFKHPTDDVAAFVCNKYQSKEWSNHHDMEREKKRGVSQTAIAALEAQLFTLREAAARSEAESKVQIVELTEALDMALATAERKAADAEQHAQNARHY